MGTNVIGMGAIGATADLGLRIGRSRGDWILERCARHDFLFQKVLILDRVVFAIHGKSWGAARSGGAILLEYWES